MQELMGRPERLTRKLPSIRDWDQEMSSVQRFIPNQYPVSMLMDVVRCT